VVIFQEFVVHSIKNWGAEVAKQATIQKTEWNITILPEPRFIS
jgi:hypothetical protein